jgi:hypothetical protein
MSIQHSALSIQPIPTSLACQWVFGYVLHSTSFSKFFAGLVDFAVPDFYSLKRIIAQDAI